MKILIKRTETGAIVWKDGYNLPILLAYELDFCQLLVKTQTEIEKNCEIIDVGEFVCSILPHGSGFDADWYVYHIQKNGTLVLQGGIHCMNDNGSYDGWITVRVYYNPKAQGFPRITLSGNRKYHWTWREPAEIYVDQAFIDNDLAGWQIYNEIYRNNRNAIIEIINA